MGTPRVLILGHSFIRRLHDFIESNSGHLDLKFHLQASAHISWHGVGGRAVAKTVKFDLHIIHSFRPDVVYRVYAYARLSVDTQLCFSTTESIF